MAGRNNRPEKRGPQARPSDLDQFGQEMADEALLQGEVNQEKKAAKNAAARNQQK
jgi:hypothetical protein